MKNDGNAFFDVKMNKNSGVKIFRRRATFIQGGTFIPESRVICSIYDREYCVARSFILLTLFLQFPKN